MRKYFLLIVIIIFFYRNKLVYCDDNINTLEDTILELKKILYHLLKDIIKNEDFIDQIPHGQLVKYEPNVFVDFRTTNELAVLKQYLETFGSDISWIYATLDARPATFYKANQTNPDFWIYIDKGLGLIRNKCTYQDEKSGRDMVKHAMRGSIGALYFDENGENIQITSQPITTKAIISYNYKKIEDIKNGLIQDGIPLDLFADQLASAKQIVINMEGKNFHGLQTLLWNNLQCNPGYNRSISFVFLKQVILSPMTEKEAIFSQTFQSKLKDNHLYDLDKKSDLNEMYNAFLYAGKKVDPYFMDKLYHMHENGITLTHDLLFIMKKITKNAIH